MRRSLPLALLLAACRPDPGVPDYGPMQEILKDDAAGGPLPGPSPWVTGTKRLSLGLFYEGGHSEFVALDATHQYFIFVLEGTSTLTYAQEVTVDRVEGVTADELRMAGTPWWGGGIIWTVPADLSSWKTLHVSLKSTDAGLAGTELRMQSGPAGGAVTTASVAAKGYGFASDGAWHHLAVPLADFAAKGLDPAKVRGPFLLGGTGAKSGESLLVDNLYLE